MSSPVTTEGGVAVKLGPADRRSASRPRLRLPLRRPLPRRPIKFFVRRPCLRSSPSSRPSIASKPPSQLGRLRRLSRTSLACFASRPNSRSPRPLPSTVTSRRPSTRQTVLHTPPAASALEVPRPLSGLRFCYAPGHVAARSRIRGSRRCSDEPCPATEETLDAAGRAGPFPSCAQPRCRSDHGCGRGPAVGGTLRRLPLADSRYHLTMARAFLPSRRSTPTSRTSRELRRRVALPTRQPHPLSRHGLHRHETERFPTGRSNEPSWPHPVGFPKGRTRRPERWPALRASPDLSRTSRITSLPHRSVPPTPCAPARSPVAGFSPDPSRAHLAHGLPRPRVTRSTVSWPLDACLPEPPELQHDVPDHLHAAGHPSARHPRREIGCHLPSIAGLVTERLARSCSHRSRSPRTSDTTPLDAISSSRRCAAPHAIALTGTHAADTARSILSRESSNPSLGCFATEPPHDAPIDDTNAVMHASCDRPVMVWRRPAMPCRQDTTSHDEPSPGTDDTRRSEELLASPTRRVDPLQRITENARALSADADFKAFVHRRVRRGTGSCPLRTTRFFHGFVSPPRPDRLRANPSSRREPNPVTFSVEHLPRETHTKRPRLSGAVVASRANTTGDLLGVFYVKEHVSTGSRGSREGSSRSFTPVGPNVGQTQCTGRANSCGTDECTI